jgi:5-methylcytosine-specific restriction endonuclease McrA
MKNGEMRECETCKEEFYAIPSEISIEGHARFCSQSCGLEGEHNHRWNGGSDKFFEKEAGRAWRKAVYQRDNYCCQDCGDDSGGNLNAHHIKRRENCDNFEKHAVWNGVTLCRDCHADRHKGEPFEQMIRTS